MKVAVSGASGFIGKYVISNLLQRNVELIALTRNKAKLNDLADRIEIVEIDIANPDECTFEQIGSPDVLIHLAWDGLPNYKSLYHYEVELPKQYTFLKKLISTGLRTIFIAGTCFEYGMQTGELLASTDTRPTNPYGYAKDALRKQLEFLKDEFSYNLIWGRLFYMYGEGQQANSLYSQLKQAILRGDKFFNMSGGEQIRDYLHVSKVAEKIVEFSIFPHGYDCLNICSGNPITVKQLVYNWLQENNWEIELNFGYYPYPDYEPMNFWGHENPINILN